MLAREKTVPQTQERRRFQRVPVMILGRYMLENRREYPCQTLNMSPGGIALIAPVQGAIGERVVVYLEHIGRVEGKIVRLIENGFAMTLNATVRKRDKIASQLTWLANRDTLGLPEDRRHDRVVPRNPFSTLTFDDGSVMDVRVFDVSISGAGLSGATVPDIGTPVRLGFMLARVVRHFDGGFAVEFRQPLSNEQFNEDIVF